MKTDNIYEFAKKVNSKQDFIQFLNFLINDYENKNDWENDTIDLFLDGMMGYIQDSLTDEISWKNLTEIFLAAKVYE
ncbi:DUF7660 family protein [Ornithobacterium rhinotracheale]|uniref:DUF7660 family protein n=1 Tax=Ornithobacterium rhinotracheale TaxID=28251 RepID=UPI004035FD80